MKSQIKNTFFAILGTAILVLVRYWDTIFNYKIVGNSKDSVHLIGPVFKKANELMLSGQQPYWFEELVGGIPFFNNAMFSFTYPFYFLGYLNYGDGIEVLRTISLLIVLHMGLLFISMIALLRVLGFDWWIAILAGFSIILCLNTAYNSPWIIAIAGYALVPLFFAGIISLINHKSSLPGVVMLSVGSLSFLAKPAQTAILAIVFGGILTVIGLWSNRANIRILIPRFILAGVLIIGINLPGLVQLFLDFPEMIRFTAGGGAVSGNTPIPLEAYNSQVDFSELGDYLIYQTKSIGVGHPWTGPLTIFSFLSFWMISKYSPKHKSWVLKTFFWITLATIIIAFGKELPTFWLHYKAPLLNKIRESSRFLFIANIGFAVLLGYFLSIGKAHWNKPNIQRLVFGFLGFSFIISCWQLYLYTPVNLLGIIYLMLGLLLLYLSYQKKSYNLVLVTVGLISVLYALILPSLRYGNNQVSGFGNPENLAVHEVLSALKEVEPNADAFRCMYHIDEVRDGEFSNAGLYYNLRSLQGTTVVIPQNQYEDLWHSEKYLNYRLFWGAKWHIFRNDSIPESALFKKVVQTSNYSVYRHKKALPRAYFANKIIQFDGDAKQFRRKLDRQNYPSRLAYLTDSIISQFRYLQEYPSDNKSQVDEVSFFNNTLSIKVSQKKRAFLTINEYYSDHWKASIDNNPVDIIKTNVNQMGIISPAGNHLIKLEYKPYPFIYFKQIQLVCFIILTMLILVMIFLPKLRTSKLLGNTSKLLDDA